MHASRLDGGYYRVQEVESEEGEQEQKQKMEQKRNQEQKQMKMQEQKGDTTSTGMLSEGTMVSIWASTPTAGEMMEFIMVLK